MVWTAPEVGRPDGSLLAPETEMIREMLDWQRATLLYKCAGLSGEQLARMPVDENNLSLLGLIRHMAKVERIWFRERLQGEEIGRLYVTPERPDADWEDLDPTRAETEYAQLLAEQDIARQAAADVSLDTTLPGYRGDGRMSLRMLHFHMISEYARHNGHADLLRQRIDGATGY